MPTETSPEFFFWEANFEFLFPANQSFYDLPCSFGPFENIDELIRWRSAFVCTVEIKAMQMNAVDFQIRDEGRVSCLTDCPDELEDYSYSAVGCSDPESDAANFFYYAVKKWLEEFNLGLLKQT